MSHVDRESSLGVLPKLRQAYQDRIADASLAPDPAQDAAVSFIADFAGQMDRYTSQKLSFWRLLCFPKYSLSTLPFAGLYLYGDVGRGKSMLMDLFYTTVSLTKKRRVHFHQFMLEIHERLHQLQKEHEGDVMRRLARDLARDTRLLCFDEFHVSNIVDAMILGRLFEALFSAGVIIVATSNWPPSELYKNGLQRERFLPFIDLIKKKMLVYRLGGEVDHRYERIKGMPTYFSPLSDENTRKLQGLFIQLTEDAAPEIVQLPVQGRTLKIVHTARGVGFFNFDELCVEVMGAADYLAIAACLHTVFLDGVPRMRTEYRNETLRFVTLIDALYEAKVKLFMATEVPLEKLAPSGEHAFEFQRTLSRLMEMQSEDYRKKSHLS